MSGNIANSKVTQKPLIAFKSELAVAVPVVLDASIGANGVVVAKGTLLNPAVSGKYLPLAVGDTVTPGQTKVLSQDVTLTGEDCPGLSGLIAGYLVKASLVGSPTQIAALGPEVEPGVILMKQW